MSYLTNSSKLSSSKELSGYSKSISNSFARLSSGMRINKISDDAAGLAEGVSVDLSRKLANRGVANLQDGVSAMNIADSALGEMSNILTRIKELAQQASNGTYSDNQRLALHDEANALASEYNRVIQTTEFNDTKLLTGAGAGINYKAGFDQVGDIRSQIGGNVTSDAYGIYSTGTTSLVSVTANGTQGNADVTNGAIDGSGRYVVFTSTSNNLIASVSGEQTYLKDTISGELTLVSANSAGATSNGTTNTGRNITKDGKFATFTSDATNLVTGVTGTQMYIKNLETNQITLVSSNLAGVQSDANVTGGGGVSADNRYVTFTATATNLVSGVTGEQNYVKDLLTGEVHLATSDSSGNQSAAGLVGAGISHSGNVYFTTTATNIISGVSGQQAYFKDISTGITKLVSSNASGVMSNGTNSTVSNTADNATADDRYVVFDSNATNLVSGVTGNHIYKKDMLTGDIEVVSRNESGDLANGTSVNARITSDGRYLMFRSNATNLVDGVTGNQMYRKDLTTGKVDLISRSTNGQASTGTVSSIVRFSEDGLKAVFISSGTNLVSGDANGSFDIFKRDMSEAGVQKLGGVILTDQASAIRTSDLVQGYIEELNLAKASVGAATSRMEFANSHLHSLSTNYADAKSKIMDVDVAEESATLVSNQIKQKAAIAMQAHKTQSYEQNLLVMSAH